MKLLFEGPIGKLTFEFKEPSGPVFISKEMINQFNSAVGLGEEVTAESTKVPPPTPRAKPDLMVKEHIKRGYKKSGDRGAKRAEVEEMVRSGLSNPEIYKKTGYSKSYIHTIAKSVQGGGNHKSKHEDKVSDGVDISEVSDDVIELVLEDKKFSERTDLEIAFEHDLTPEQVRYIYKTKGKK